VKISLDWYLSWLRWAYTTAEKLCKAQEYEQLYQFSRDIISVVGDLVMEWRDFPSGRGIALALSIVSWAKKLRDPLHNTRASMKSIQLTWTAWLVARTDA